MNDDVPPHSGSRGNRPAARFSGRRRWAAPAAGLPGPAPTALQGCGARRRRRVLRRRLGMSHVTAPPTVPQRRVVAARPASGRARLDAVVRSVAVSALWLSLLLVTYWWATGGGIQDLGGWATGLTSLGRLTGLVASVLLLAQVLLMARRAACSSAAFGQDRLARLHRLVGFTSFNLMLAHIVLITWGYAAGQLSRRPATLWNLTVDYPGMLLAAGGTVCLVMVVVTSVKAARRRLRYESWHLLHLYAYLGVGLALPHQLWTGQQFLSSPGADRVLVDGSGPWPPARSWSGGSACRCGATLRHRLRVTSVVREARRRRVGLPDRPPAGPAAGRGRAVLHLAVPRPARAGPAPTRTRCRPRPTAAACGSPSRTLGDGSAAAAHAAARHAGAGRGAVRPAQPAGPHPAQGRR